MIAPNAMHRTVLTKGAARGITSEVTLIPRPCWAMVSTKAQTTIAINTFQFITAPPFVKIDWVDLCFTSHCKTSEKLKGYFEGFNYFQKLEDSDGYG